MGDFHEDDEPPGEVLAAYERGRATTATTARAVTVWACEHMTVSGARLAWCGHGCEMEALR